MNTDIRSYSLHDFQLMIERIYGRANDQNYNASDLVSRAHRDVTLILKSTRKGRIERNRHQMCMALSWTIALANRLRIDLDAELWKCYPGVCPYCATAICSCKEKRASKRQAVKQAAGDTKPDTLRGYQEMLARIYPENTLMLSAMHLAEEAGEVDEALSMFMGTHNPDLFAEVTIETVDVVANILGVATCAGIDIADEMAIQFKNGCPHCSHNECRCGFTAAAHSVSRVKNVA